MVPRDTTIAIMTPTQSTSRSHVVICVHWTIAGSAGQYWETECLNSGGGVRKDKKYEDGQNFNLSNHFKFELIVRFHSWQVYHYFVLSKWCWRRRTNGISDRQQRNIQLWGGWGSHSTKYRQQIGIPISYCPLLRNALSFIIRVFREIV